jgi:hypothetical protein
MICLRPLHVDHLPFQAVADITELTQVGQAQQRPARAFVDSNPLVWNLVCLFDDLNSTHEIDPRKQTWTANRIYAQAAARSICPTRNGFPQKESPEGDERFPGRGLLGNS